MGAHDGTNAIFSHAHVRFEREGGHAKASGSSGDTDMHPTQLTQVASDEQVQTARKASALATTKKTTRLIGKDFLDEVPMSTGITNSHVN